VAARRRQSDDDAEVAHRELIARFLIRPDPRPEVPRSGGASLDLGAADELGERLAVTRRPADSGAKKTDCPASRKCGEHPVGDPVEDDDADPRVRRSHARGRRGGHSERSNGRQGDGQEEDRT
jgi:hypothetical protein